MSFVLLKAPVSIRLIGSAAHTSCFNVDTLLSAIMFSEDRQMNPSSRIETESIKDEWVLCNES